MKFFRIYILLILLITNSYSKEPLCSDYPNEIIISSKIKKSHKTLFALTIDKNNFNDLKNFFGSISILDRNPSCASCEEETCYISKKKDIGIIYYRYTRWDYLGFTITNDLEKIQESHCLINEKINSDISTKSGLKLGLTKKEILNLLGKPTKRVKNVYTFNYETKVKVEQEIIKQQINQDLANKKVINCNNYYYDSIGTIKVYFDKNDFVKELKVSYMKSF